MTGERSPLLSNDVATDNMEQQHDEARIFIDEGPDYVAEQAGIAVLESVMDHEQPAHESEEMRWLREARIKHQHLSSFQRPSLAILCCLLMLISLAETLCITPMISLTMKKVCEGIMTANGDVLDSAQEMHCDPKKVQTIMSGISSTILILTGLSFTFTSGTWGEFSDRVGRVRIFGYMALLKVIGNGVHLWALLPSTPYNKWVIILAGSVSSLSGGMLALLANANSYIADIAEPDQRAMSMSIMMSTVYGTMGLGPIVGSLLVKFFSEGDRLPIYLSLIVGTIATLSCFTIIKEPRHDDALKLSQATFMERRESISSTRSSGSHFSAKMKSFSRLQLLRLIDVFSSLKKLWLKPTARGSLAPRYTVLLLIVIDILFLSITVGSLPTLVLFATYQYGWRSVELGYFISISGLGRAAVLLVLSPCLIHLLKKRYKPLSFSVDRIDIICIMISLAFLIMSFLTALIGLGHEGSLFACATLQALSAFCSPALQSAIIKYCSKKFTGQCFGAIALIRSVVMLIVPPTLLRIYGATVSFKPELFLYIPLMSGISALILSSFLRIVDDKEELRRDSEVNVTYPSKPLQSRKDSPNSKP